MDKLNLKEAAKRLGVSPLTLRRKVINREISHTRTSERGHIRFTNEQLEEFERQHTFVAKFDKI